MSLHPVLGDAAFSRHKIEKTVHVFGDKQIQIEEQTSAGEIGKPCLEQGEFDPSGILHPAEVEFGERLDIDSRIKARWIIREADEPKWTVKIFFNTGI